MNQKIRILLVDDHPLMREALRAAIEDEEDMEVISEASNGQQAVEQAHTLQPDVIVMDLFMPGMDGMRAIATIHEQHPDLHILALTSSADETKIVEAVQSGALGYLLKDARRSEIIEAIREVSQGQSYLPPQLARKLLNGLRQQPKAGHLPEQSALETLTPRELEVLKAIGGGASNREIAARLFLSEGTVRTHVHHILSKLELSNRNQAILYALHAGLVDPSDSAPVK